MKVVVDRLVQYPNRYTLTNVTTGAELGTFDFEESTGTVQQVGTEINKELFDSIAADFALKLDKNGGNASAVIVEFSATTTTANLISGETLATLFAKLQQWFAAKINPLKSFAYTSTKIAKSDIADGVIPPVVQATGTSTVNVMSQSATTTAVNTALTNAKDYADDAVNMTWANKVVQTTGISTTSVMSQKAVTDELAKKVDKVDDKGLSTNDYTTAEKNKLATVEEGATKLVVATNTVLGGVKSGEDIDVSIDGKVKVVDNSHNHVAANITDLQPKLDAKVDKVTGKGLSTNDFSTAEKTKLAGIPSDAINGIGYSTTVEGSTISSTVKNFLIKNSESVVQTSTNVTAYGTAEISLKIVTGTISETASQASATLPPTARDVSTNLNSIKTSLATTNTNVAGLRTDLTTLENTIGNINSLLDGVNGEVI